MPYDTDALVHTPPPCPFADCQRATAASDQQRAEIAAILRRLDEAEQLSGEDG